MRISDWISDVCSSDLVRRAHADAAAIRLGQPHDEPRHRGLAGAGLANQAERLALVDGEAAVFSRLDAPGPPPPAAAPPLRFSQPKHLTSLQAFRPAGPQLRLNGGPRPPTGPRR